MAVDCNHKIVDNDGCCIHCGRQVEEPGWIDAWSTWFNEEDQDFLDNIDEEE